jgi:hypothetical protein
MFPGAGSPPTTVWTALRPHNWRPATSTEWLVELDMVTGEGGRGVTGVTGVKHGHLLHLRQQYKEVWLMLSSSDRVATHLPSLVPSCTPC